MVFFLVFAIHLFLNYIFHSIFASGSIFYSQSQFFSCYPKFMFHVSFYVHHTLIFLYISLAIFYYKILYQQSYFLKRNQHSLSHVISL